jgi:hypothetical protein
MRVSVRVRIRLETGVVRRAATIEPEDAKRWRFPVRVTGAKAGVVSQELVAPPFPPPVPPPVTPPVGGSDTTAPTVLSVSTSPSTASPGDTITVSAHVTDAGTGVTNVGLQASLNGTTTPWCNEYASLASGTAQDGTWSMNCAVPTTANSGTYSVYPYASDAAGNWVNTNGGPTTSVRGSFTVR